MIRRLSTMLNDPEVKSSLKVSLPLVLVELVNSLYSLTDTYFVKGLGKEALAALGIAGYLLMLTQVFFTLFQTPLLILSSQSIGARYLEKARLIAGEALVEGSVFITAVSMLSYIFAEQVVELQSGASGATLSYTVEYFRIRIAGFIVLYLSMVLDTLIIASGRTMYSLASNSIGLVANIILDPVMIYGLLGFPRLGVAGAAYATVASSSLTILSQLFYLSRLGLTPRFTYPFTMWRRIIALGLPAFMERGILSLGQNIYAGVIARLGDTVMAAHNVGLRIESVVYMPGFAFAMTASTLVGHHVGRGDLEGARSIGRKVIMLGALTMGLLGFMVAVLGRYIVAPFAPDEAIRELASLYLLLAGLSELGLGLAMTSSGAIRGAGNTKIPFITNTASLTLFRIIPSIILAGHLGALGPWLSMFIEVYLRGIISFTIFTRGFNKLVHKYL